MPFEIKLKEKDMLQRGVQCLCAFNLQHIFYTPSAVIPLINN